jgi:hypothetical protein
MSTDRGEWVALALDGPSHWWGIDDATWPCPTWRLTTACGVGLYKPDGFLRRPLYMRGLDMREVDKWSDDPAARLPEHPYCRACYRAATGRPQPAAELAA